MFRNADFNLALLTEFNSSLVTCFDPEGMPGYTEDDADKLDYCNTSANQHEDMLAAYLYAQQAILPSIRKNGIEAITTSDLIGWLNGIHARIAAELGVIHGAKAGEFATKDVIRWQYNTTTGNILSSFCCDLINTTHALALLIAEGVERPLATSILKIATKKRHEARSNKAIMAHRDPKNPKWMGDITLTLIYDALNKNLFSKEETDDINQFVKFCIPHEKMPAAMQAFAEKLLARWKCTRVENMDELCNLLYFAFYELTEIHPYFNGNGRTATCLVNIILRSFDQPSILIREPHERDDKSSLYSRTIQSLSSQNPNPALFAELVKYRLTQTKEHGVYKNTTLDALIPLRVKIARLRSKIAAISSAKKEQEIHHAIIEQTKEELVAYMNKHGFGYSDTMSLFANNLLLPIYEARLRELENQMSNNVVRFNPTAKTYTAQEKSALADMLAGLSAYDQWKIYQKNGALVALHTVTNDEQGHSLIATLKKTGTCDAILQRVATDKSLVVYVSNINIAALNKLSSTSVPEAGVASNSL